ncbi:hydroxycarboxylic acid receptor 2-like [Megalobrama amblycephala]|uniref:hydroxycarboxylic acid receptor 2-like n=1 Tax=Megalobrama amblycephala TaxID=75352 RepID=UPI0020145695|nr:hydroxycarboxylic acid receptor 2-like [Megalobrama amblycephala]
MNNYTVSFTTPEASTNSTADSFWLLESLKMCMFSINLLFGFPTHSYVIWLIVTGTGSGVASEFFNLNLSVCEIGNCLNCLFYIMSICFQRISKLPLFLLGLFFTGRPLFQCLICVERYLAVVHPVTFLKFKPLRYRVICCTVAWINILGSCFCCLFIVFTKNGEMHTQFFSLQFLLAICIQMFCLVAVLRALKHSGPGERRRERKEENHMKKRAFQIILITTVSMTIIYVPFATTGLITILTNNYIHKLWITSLICYVLAGFVQPVLYLHRTLKFSCLCSPYCAQ